MKESSVYFDDVDLGSNYLVYERDTGLLVDSSSLGIYGRVKKTRDKVYNKYTDFAQINFKSLRVVLERLSSSEINLFIHLIIHLDYHTNICFWEFFDGIDFIKLPVSRNMICDKFGYSRVWVSKLMCNLSKLNILKEGYYNMEGVGRIKVIFINPSLVSRKSLKPAYITNMFTDLDEKKDVLKNTKGK